MEPVVYESPNHKYSNLVLAAAAMAGFAMVWVGSSGYAATGLYTSTVDVTAYKNGNGVEAGIEVAEDGTQALYGAAVSTAPFGRYRAGLSREGDGPITQSLDITHAEAATNYKVGLKRAGDAAWKWKAGVTSQRSFSAGGGSATGAGDDALVLTADLGAKEGDIKYSAGVKSTDGELAARLGVSGGTSSGGNNWAFGLQADPDGQVSYNIGLGANN